MARDSVRRDRAHGVAYVRLPKAGVRNADSLRVGETITLAEVNEEPLSPDIKDPMQIHDQPEAEGYGEAVFDAMASGNEILVCDPMADGQ